MAHIKKCYFQSSYAESEQLLYHLYSKIFSDEQEDSLDEILIKQAPHWRLLRDYGGPLSIEEFRESFKTVEYEDMDDEEEGEATTSRTRTEKKERTFSIPLNSTSVFKKILTIN